MASPMATLIVAPDSETARDAALERTRVGDHVFFALPDGLSASLLADTFRDRDPLAASAALESGPLPVITSAVLAHGGIDALIIVLDAPADAVHECEPQDVLDNALGLPWSLVRAAAPFLRERRGVVRFVVRGDSTCAALMRAALTALAGGWKTGTGLDVRLES